MVLEVKRPRPMWEILFSTHHTDIGLLYIISSLTFLFMGGALALSIRSELFLPGAHIFGMGPGDFERIFTVHGSNMLLLWVIPFAAGVGNYLIPIYVRYKDMAWPKLNAVAFWMIPVAAALVWIGFSDVSWVGAAPYSVIRSAGPATDMWIFGMKILGISSILGSVNFVVTILRCKHPDLPIMKMSLFAWAILVQSFMIIVAMPTFSAAMLMMYTDRLGVTGFFNPAMGGDPIAYQHLFWFTFHPEVYIFVIPAVGMAYEMIPKFSRKPIFSYQSGVVAFTLLGTLGFASWAHHMFATGMPFTEKTVFMIGTLAAVPGSAMHVFNFVATMWGGRIKFAAPMLFTVGGIMLFYSAGAGGVVNTAIPLDFITHDSYFIVGHFHLFMMGTVTFVFIGVVYYLFPLITGRMYNERAAQVQFIVVLIGVSLLFGTQHMAGLYGQPRRTFDYVPIPPLIIMNQIETIGAWMVGPAMGLMLINLLYSAVKGRPVETRDPFEIGEQYYNYARREPHLA
ncbi:MAG TPA: cbb3-type cytochrome c oxidase subunit I [Candidatus Bathyarchaeia archaeon]|nr:cbb3-type cytochrome c oxidase subunit I [Candidatus Bathyarchaeia archaeon]